MIPTLSDLEAQFLGETLNRLPSLKGGTKLAEKVANGDPSAMSEVTAIHLFVSRRPGLEVEIEPKIEVDGRAKKPDFRLRIGTAPWTYVEVTKLNRSRASAVAESVVRGIAERISEIQGSFLLEVVLWRCPEEGEDIDLVDRTAAACMAPSGTRIDVAELAAVLVKSGDPTVLEPSLDVRSDEPRTSIGTSLFGPEGVSRQVIVSVPFADERAANVLAQEAAQLPRNEPGIVMVDIRAQPSATKSWVEVIPLSFTEYEYRQVSGLVLFHTAWAGRGWIQDMRLIENVHATDRLPDWVTDVIAENRVDMQNRFGFV